MLDYCGSGSCPMTGCNEHSNQMPRCVQEYLLKDTVNQPTDCQQFKSGLVLPQRSITPGRSGGTHVESGHRHRQSL